MSTNGSSETVPRPSRLKNALKNFALFAFTLLLCFALAEMVLRYMDYGNLEIYEPHPQLYWWLKPSQHCYTKVNRQPVEINAHRTRGADFATAKPAGVKRVLCLGDSRTFGWGLSEPETYAAVLQERLRARFGPGVEVINAGVNGWTFPQMTVFLRDHAPAWQPDVVVLGDGNLWTQFSEKNDPAFARKFAWRVRLKNLLRRFALYHFVVETQLRSFYESYRTKFIPVDPAQDGSFRAQQQQDPAVFFHESLATFCRVAQSNQIQPVLLYLPPEEALHSTNNRYAMILEVKRAVARELAVPLLDPTAEMAAQAKPLYLPDDPVHFNAAGNEIIGHRLFEVVSPLLKP